MRMILVPKSQNALGAILMCTSMGALTCNDAAMKLASVDQSVYQSIFIRGLFAVTFLGIIAWRTGAFETPLSPQDRKLVGWRTLAEAFATLLFLTALVHMPIANLTAIMQALPLTISLAAAFFLGEPLGLRRLIAIMAGFCGVALIMRPDAGGFDIYSILAVLAVLFVTARDLVVRRFSRDVSSAKVAFITALAIMALGAVMTLVTQTWVPVGLAELSLLALAACFIFVAYLATISAMRHGEVSFVAPMRYTAMIWAIALGWFIWGETMDRWSVLGMTIIISAGVFTFWRERKLARQRIMSKAV